MKRMQLAVLAGGLAVSAAAFGNMGNAGDTNTGNPTTSGISNHPEGVMLVQRSVYVPVTEKGNVDANDMVVVERQAFIPADDLKTTSRSQGNGDGMSSGTTGQAPDAVFVLVPTTQGNQSSSGTTGSDSSSAGSDSSSAGSDSSSAGSASSSGSHDEQRVRRLSQNAFNDTRCSDLTGALPDECYAKGGTGASATGSTQVQSGG